MVMGAYGAQRGKFYIRGVGFVVNMERVRETRVDIFHAAVVAVDSVLT